MVVLPQSSVGGEGCNNRGHLVELGIRYFGVEMAANPKVNCAGGQVRHRRLGPDCLELRIIFNYAQKKYRLLLLLRGSLISPVWCPHAS